MSGYVESFSYHEGILHREVHMSIKKKVCKVTVSNSKSKVFRKLIYHRMAFS